MPYRVLAGYVTVEMDIPGGRARQDVRRGLILPADVPRAEVQMLLERGDIEEVKAPESQGPPPKRGPGSGADAWTSYAQSAGVSVPDGAKAGEIRELLEERGIPTE